MFGPEVFEPTFACLEPRTRKRAIGRCRISSYYFSTPPSNNLGLAALYLGHLVVEMARDTLIDKHVSTKLCEKAIEALLKYTQKRRAEEDESTLFRDEEQAIWLVIGLKQMQPNAYKLKPHRMCVLATLYIHYKVSG